MWYLAHWIVFLILESTCFLNEVTNESASALSGNLACEQILIQMDLDGLFISKVGKNPITYKLNELVRKFLQDQITKDSKRYQNLLGATADEVAVEVEVDGDVRCEVALEINVKLNLT